MYSQDISDGYLGLYIYLKQSKDTISSLSTKCQQQMEVTKHIQSTSMLGSNAANGSLWN